MKFFWLLLITYPTGDQREIYFSEDYTCDMISYFVNEDPIGMTAECIETNTLAYLFVRPPTRPEGWTPN